MLRLVHILHDVVVSEHKLREGLLNVGRLPDNHLQLEDSTVSNYHAVISVEKNPLMDQLMDIYLEDLGSTNGTRVNDKSVSGKLRINNGDVISIGTHKFKIIDDSNIEIEQTRFQLPDEES